MKRVKRIKEKKTEGSFTIELTLLMPCILGVIFLIIYLGFYVHDAAVIERACHAAVIQTRNVRNLSDHEDEGNNPIDEGQYVERVERCFTDSIDGRLIGRWMLTTDVMGDNSESVFTVKGTMSILGAVGNIYKGILGYSTRDASSKEYCEDVVRDMAYEARINDR